MAVPAVSSSSALGRNITLDPRDPLVQSLGRRAIGTVGGVANFLDIPGSMVRDVVSSAATGKIQNPFDQLLPWNWTNQQGRITGRQLNRQLGLSGPRDTTGNWWGGLGTEIALDPLTYLSFGGSALSKGGQIARSAGAIGDLSRVGRMTTGLSDIAARATPKQLLSLENAAAKQGFRNLGEATATLGNKPLGSLVGFNLPFGKSRAIGGTGPMAQRFAGGLDATGKAIRESYPVRHLAGMFDSRVRDTLTKFGQPAARQLSKRREELLGETRQFVGRQVQRLHNAGLDVDSDEVYDSLRRAFEDPLAQGPPQLVGDELVFPRAGARSDFLAQHPELAPMFDEVGEELTQQLVRAQDAGLDPQQLLDQSIAEYFPRYASKLFKRDPGSARTFSTIDPSFDIRRKAGLRDVVGGTETVRNILKDEQLQRMLYSGRTASEMLDPAARNAAWNPAKQKQITDYLMQNWSDAFLDKRHASAFSKAARKLSPDSMVTGLFGNHPLVDLNARMLHSRYAAEAAHSVYDMLSNTEVYQWTGRSGERVGVTELLGRLGVNKDSGLSQLSQRLGWDPTDIEQLTFAREIADDATRMMKAFTAPDTVNPLVKALDSVTNLFKGYVTGLWPAFHVRNLVSGQFQNFLGGNWSKGSWDVARRVIRGEAPAGLSSVPAIRQRLAAEGIGITDDNAADMLRRMAFEHDLVHQGQGDVTNVIGSLGDVEGGRISDLLSQFPGGLRGSRGFRWGGVARKASALDPETSFNPFAQRGVGGRRESEFFLGAAGEDVGYWIESMNRLVPFVDQLKRGVDPAEAANVVKAAQVDYSSRMYTQFEKQALQRIFPFYKFSSRMLPFHMRMLIEQPGGRLGQMLRAISRGRAEDQGPLPEYVSDTAAVQIPKDWPILGSGGNDPRFLTGTGLMWEDTLSMMPVGGVGARGAGLELLSRTNPLIKGPLEALTNQSFFQRGPRGGRPLSDLDPVTGRTLRNFQQIPQMGMSDFLHGNAPEGYTPPVQYPGQRYVEPTLLNSPLSRVFTSARTITDPRKSIVSKAANLLSGLRITDVSEASQEAILRERAFHALSEFPESREFTKSYIPTDQLTDMDESARLEAEQLLALVNMLARRSQARKREQER